MQKVSFYDNDVSCFSLGINSSCPRVSGRPFRAMRLRCLAKAGRRWYLPTTSPVVFRRRRYLYVVTRMASGLAAAQGTAPISRQICFHRGPWVRSPWRVQARAWAISCRMVSRISWGLPDWRGQSGRRGRCFFPAGGIRPAACGHGPSRISNPGGPVHPFSGGHKFQCPGSCRGCRIGGSRWSCCGESIARSVGRKYGEGHHDGVAAEGMVFLRKQTFFFAESRKKKACGKVEGQGSVIGDITMISASGTKPQRIAAIDALRVFDMFFLTGGWPW